MRQACTQREVITSFEEYPLIVYIDNLWIGNLQGFMVRQSRSHIGCSGTLTFEELNPQIKIEDYVDKTIETVKIFTDERIKGGTYKRKTLYLDGVTLYSEVSITGKKGYLFSLYAENITFWQDEEGE